MVKRKKTWGLTLLELVIAMGIIAVALFGLISVISYTTRSNLSVKQRVLAMRAAERKIEQMAATTPFINIYNKYTSYGTGMPNAGFGVDAVDGLNDLNVPPDAKSQIVRVKFPIDNSGNIMESLTGALLGEDGMPLANIDLNGDGDAVDTVLVTDLKVLPCRVEVTWKGVMGTSKLIYRYIFLSPP